MKKINIITAIILLLLCAGYFLMIRALPQRNFQNTLSGSFLPTLLLIVLIFLTSLMLIKNIFFGTVETCQYRIRKREIFGLTAVTVLIIVYVFVMQYLGFLITTPFVVFTLMKLTGGGKLKETIIVSVSATLLIYFFFDFIFKVQLPSGILL